MEEEISPIEKFYIEKRLPKEVETLPYDLLDEEDQEIIDKIRAKEELSKEEVSKIKETRMEYDSVLKKYDANEIIKSNEILEETIATEQELLDMVYNQDDIVIKMYIPTKNGEKLFPFTVKPLTDSRAVQMLDQHIDIFRDLSDEERKIYAKDSNGQKLNPKEEAVLEHINNKISENRTRSQMDEICNFLAYQIEEPKDMSYEEKVEFWERFDFFHRVALYGKVIEKLGLTQEFNDKLFQD